MYVGDSIRIVGRKTKISLGHPVCVRYAGVPFNFYFSHVPTNRRVHRVRGDDGNKKPHSKIPSPREAIYIMVLSNIVVRGEDELSRAKFDTILLLLLLFAYRCSSPGFRLHIVRAVFTLILSTGGGPCRTRVLTTIPFYRVKHARTLCYSPLRDNSVIYILERNAKRAPVSTTTCPQNVPNERHVCECVSVSVRYRRRGRKHRADVRAIDFVNRASVIILLLQHNYVARTSKAVEERKKLRVYTFRNSYVHTTYMDGRGGGALIPTTAADPRKSRGG